LLFGTTICVGILPSYCHGDFLPATWLTPVYVFIKDIYSKELESLFTDNPGTHSVISKQSCWGHHYGGTWPDILYLSISSQTCVLASNRTRVVWGCIAGKHSSKELFEQLVYLLFRTTFCAGILPSYSLGILSPPQCYCFLFMIFFWEQLQINFYQRFKMEQLRTTTHNGPKNMYTSTAIKCLKKMLKDIFWTF